MRIRLPFNPYVAFIPLLVREGLDRVEKEQEVAFVLPSTVISEIFARGPSVMDPCLFGPKGSSEVLEYWRTEDEDFVQLLGGVQNLACTLPLDFHEDGVPRWRGETATFYSWSTPFSIGGSWVSRHCFVGLTTSSITKATRSAILDILSWDLCALKAGVFPSHDHLGKPFASESAAGKRAGKAIAVSPSGSLWTACFSHWKGDQEASAAAHDAGIYNNHRHLRLPFATDKKYTPGTSTTTHSSAATQQTDPNFTAAWLRGPEIGAVQATFWWNHPVHSHKTLAQCS